VGDAKKLNTPSEKVGVKLEHHTKEERIDIVHKAKCGKLKGMKTSEMTKDEIVAHLIKSKCPEIMKLI